MNAYYILKIVHIVGFVSWFAGLFYLVRMFVYHTEAYDAPQPDQDILKNQFHLMEKRVYGIICTPAMIITWICGLGMIGTMVYNTSWEWLGANYWLHGKILLVIIMSGYQGYCKRLIRKLKQGKTSFSSTQFRLFNEVPTLLLILISAIAVYKNNTNYVVLLVSILVVMIVLVLLTRLYKQIRSRNTSA